MDSVISFVVPSTFDYRTPLREFGGRGPTASMDDVRELQFPAQSGDLVQRE
jgi:hypothetical protein